MSKQLEITDDTVVCEKCGGFNIETRAWVDVNTDEVLDACADGDEDNWCRDCQEHLGFVSHKEFKEAEDE